METNPQMNETENDAANIKSIQEIISEIVELNSASTEKLESLNHGAGIDAIKESKETPPKGKIEQIYDSLKHIRRQSSTISRETNILIGN